MNRSENDRFSTLGRFLLDHSVEISSKGSTDHGIVTNSVNSLNQDWLVLDCCKLIPVDRIDFIQIQ